MRYCLLNILCSSLLSLSNFTMHYIFQIWTHTHLMKVHFLIKALDFSPTAKQNTISWNYYSNCEIFPCVYFNFFQFTFFHCAARNPIRTFGVVLFFTRNNYAGYMECLYFISIILRLKKSLRGIVKKKITHIATCRNYFT